MPQRESIRCKRHRMLVEMDQSLGTVSVADRVWKISCALRSELMQTKLIFLLVEWCEMPGQRQSCLCYQDLCVRYDADPDKAVKIVPKASSND